ncbi:hypothetical protein BCR36DRAFT_443581 [Piromyces finnis]|uniref:Uncharacterized protein n=1 Tax=Piromyces finnis TaxID=1754191 RepID=A0A1Y1UHE5_9FUNG|nr:hypothetical protein BCR36DRAFT_443581 [Piromyces finnis]|eukprot:ORX37471.1 hypothetical protein BCR36DRAFT_443581 [Piromyces finnis]
MNYGLIVVIIVLLSTLMVLSLAHSKMQRIIYVVLVFLSTVLKRIHKSDICMLTLNSSNKTSQMLIIHLSVFWLESKSFS